MSRNQIHHSTGHHYYHFFQELRSIKRRTKELAKYIHYREILSVYYTSTGTKIQSGYYTVARRYEFCVRVARTVSHG